VQDAAIGVLEGERAPERLVLGLGVRLPTYDFEDAELTGAADRLLADSVLHDRLTAISNRLKANPGTVRAADLIESVARGT